MRFLPAFVLIAVLTMSGCNAASPADPKQAEGEMTLKIYQVPEGYQRTLVDIMNKNFNSLRDKDQGSKARIDLLPNGSLVLIGPDEVHKGFSELVADLENSKKPREGNAKLECWVVLSGPDKVNDQRLQSIQEPLDALRKLGNNNFFLLEKISMSSVLGERFNLEGNYFNVQPRMTLFEDKISTQLNIKSHQLDMQLDTRLNLDPGKYVVIGESRLGRTDRLKLPEGWNGEHLNLFYIVRASSF